MFMLLYMLYIKICNIVILLLNNNNLPMANIVFILEHIKFLPLYDCKTLHNICLCSLKTSAESTVKVDHI